MDIHGIDLNPQIKANPHVEKFLYQTFIDNYSSFLEAAIADKTKRRNLIVFFWPYTGMSNHNGGYANYCVKERRFDYIQYSVKTLHGAYYAKRFLIA